MRCHRSHWQLDLSPTQLPAYAQARLEIGKVNSTLQEKVSGLRVVQSHGQQEQEAARLRALSDRFRTTRVRAQKYLAVYFPFLTFCTEASYAAVLLVGASRVAEGEMTAGVMAAFYLLLGQFYGPVQQLSGLSTPRSRRRPAVNILMNCWRPKALRT